MNTDNLTAEQRRRVMQRNRGKDTKPELLVRRYLHAQGLRYRLHDADLPGTPDVVLPRYRTVIFVHGCFWHRHGAGCLRDRGRPQTNAARWEAKLTGNVARDEHQQQALETAGWRVLTVWECELRRAERGATLHRLTREVLAEDVDADIFAENELFTQHE